MDETLMKLRILARAEMTLARVHGHRLANRIKLYSIALGLFLLTVVMVNVGAYQFLSQTHGNAVAAFLVAAANGLLAIGLIYAGRERPPGPEEQMVHEIRDMALTELSADVDAVKQEFTQLGDDVQRIRNGFTALTSGGGIGWASLGPIITHLTELLQKRKE
jgi:hypothetical protein